VRADSLAFLDMDNLVEAVGLPKINFCTACFDEAYPIEVPADLQITKYDLEAEKTQV
jgi:amidophosphoribosyltransferase